jgi:hypothetical protein
MAFLSALRDSPTAEDPQPVYKTTCALSSSVVFIPRVISAPLLTGLAWGSKLAAARSLPVPPLFLFAENAENRGPNLRSRNKVSKLHTSSQ